MTDTPHTPEDEGRAPTIERNEATCVCGHSAGDHGMFASYCWHHDGEDYCQCARFTQRSEPSPTEMLLQCDECGLYALPDDAALGECHDCPRQGAFRLTSERSPYAAPAAGEAPAGEDAETHGQMTTVAGDVIYWAWVDGCDTTICVKSLSDPNGDVCVDLTDAELNELARRLGSLRYVPTTAEVRSPSGESGAGEMPSDGALAELLLCAESWEPDARLLGNVCAADIAAICRLALASRSPSVSTPAREPTTKDERERDVLAIKVGADLAVAAGCHESAARLNRLFTTLRIPDSEHWQQKLFEQFAEGDREAQEIRALLKIPADGRSLIEQIRTFARRAPDSETGAEDATADAVERLADELECSTTPIKRRAAWMLRGLLRERERNRRLSTAPATADSEPVTPDLPEGESFTDAEAAEIGLRLLQHRSQRPIVEVDTADSDPTFDSIHYALTSRATADSETRGEDMTPYPDPTPDMLASPEFEAVWQAIKGWDIQRAPGLGYAGATGNDVRHILDALASTGARETTEGEAEDARRWRALELPIKRLADIVETETGTINLRDALVGQHSDVTFYSRWERVKARLCEFLDAVDAARWDRAAALTHSEETGQ